MDGKEVVSVLKAAVCRMTNDVDASSFLLSINHHFHHNQCPDWRVVATHTRGSYPFHLNHLSEAVRNCNGISIYLRRYANAKDVGVMLCIQKNPRMKPHNSVAEAHQYIIRAPDWTNDPQTSQFLANI